MTLVGGYPCAERECVGGDYTTLPHDAAFVPVMCAGCYLAYLTTCPDQLADPIICAKVLYALDLRDDAEGVGPAVVVRYFDGRDPLRTTRLRVVMHLSPYTPDTALVALA